MTGPGRRPGAATVRWRLDPPLPITDTLVIGEAARRGAVGCAKHAFGPDAIPWVLSGHDIPPGASHQHAFYLAEDADLDGWVDHLVIHAEAGLTPAALRALGRMRPLLGAALVERWAGDGRKLRAGGLLLGASRRWVSVTPYLPPWHARRQVGVLDLFRRECTARGLPAPAEIEALPEIGVAGEAVAADAFITRRAGMPAPPTPPGWFLLVDFVERVAGPVALGYECHLGLGLFRPLGT